MKKYNKTILAIPLMLLLCLMSFSIVSATIVNLNGGDFNDIQNGVNAAGSNGVLNLGNNFYTGSGFQINISGIDNLVIQGASNSSRATLDANFLSGIFNVKTDSSDITFKYIDFVNGNVSIDGGAGIIAHGTIVVEDCAFINNYGASGSALYIQPTAPGSQIINCQFISSRCIYEHPIWGPPEGAALDSHADDTFISGCYFEDNYGRNDAGAVSIAESTGSQIINCFFVNNSCANGGGAIHIRDSDLIISACEFRNNRAGSGGAIYVWSSELKMIGSDFESNNAEFGGAIFFDNVISGLLDNCNFKKNNASTGGAIYILESNIDLINSNFANNSANYGSAIYNDIDSVLEITSTFFTDNLAKTFDIVSPAVAGQYPYSQVVEVYLVCGDNIDDAIYNDGGSVAIDGVKPNESTARPNQKVTLNISGIIYNSITDVHGVATFNVQTMLIPVMTQSYVASYQQTTLYTGISKSPSVGVQAAEQVTRALPKSNPTPTPPPGYIVESSTKTLKKIISYWNLYLDIKTYSANDLKSMNSFPGTWLKYNSNTKKWDLIEKSDKNSLKNAVSGSYRQVIKISKETGLKKGLKLTPCIQYNCTQGSNKWVERVPATQDIFFISNLTKKELSTYENYLKLTTHCQVNNSKIKNQIKWIFQTTLYGELTPLSKTKALFNWLSSRDAYNFYYDTWYGAVKSLSLVNGSKVGRSLINCADHTHLMNAMVRTVGIPALYAHGNCYFSGDLYGHYWSMACIDSKLNKWVIIDAMKPHYKYNAPAWKIKDKKGAYYSVSNATRLTGSIKLKDIYK